MLKGQTPLIRQRSGDLWVSLEKSVGHEFGRALSRGVHFWTTTTKEKKRKGKENEKEEEEKEKEDVDVQ